MSYGMIRVFESRRFLFFTAALLILSSSFSTYGAISRNALVASPELPDALDELKWTHSEVRFQSRNAGYTTYFTESGLILAGFTRRSGVEEYFEIKLQLRNSQKDVELTTLNPMLSGNEEWRTNLPDYARIKYSNVYPGIEMLCSGNKDQLELEFVIAPGADPRKIHFQMTGADQIQLTPEGTLLLLAGEKSIEIPRPVAFQAIDESGAKYVVGSHYVRSNKNEIGLELGPYNSKRTIVIVPLSIIRSSLQ